MTNDEIERIIGRLYSWKEKRESINEKRKDDPDFRMLDNSLVTDTIRTIQYLRNRAETPRGKLG